MIRWIAVSERKHGRRGARAHVILPNATGTVCGRLDEILAEARTNSTKLKCGSCEAVVERQQIRADAAQAVHDALAQHAEIAALDDPALIARISADVANALAAAELLPETTEFEYIGGKVSDRNGEEFRGDELPLGTWGTESYARQAIAIGESLWVAEKQKRPWLRKEPKYVLARRRKTARPQIIE